MLTKKIYLANDSRMNLVQRNNKKTSFANVLTYFCYYLTFERFIYYK